MHIEPYCGNCDDEIISLILGIQNDENKLNLSLEEQPNLLDIRRCYQQDGGEFWIAFGKSGFGEVKI